MDMRIYWSTLIRHNIIYSIACNNENPCYQNALHHNLGRRCLVCLQIEHPKVPVMNLVQKVVTPLSSFILQMYIRLVKISHHVGVLNKMNPCSKNILNHTQFWIQGKHKLQPWIFRMNSNRRSIPSWVDHMGMVKW